MPDKTTLQKLPRKIAVVGTSCSGKSTLAAMVSKTLEIPHIELDALHWLPGWQETPKDEFRNKVQHALKDKEWIVDGNYPKAQDLVLSEADLLVWLDIPLNVLLGRLIRRSIQRAFSRELLWGTCKENFRNSLLSRNSLLMWIIKNHDKNRLRYSKWFVEPPNSTISLYRIQNRAEIKEFMNQLKSLNSQGAKG
jgi:adenylate kinase family enzyme